MGAGRWSSVPADRWSASARCPATSWSCRRRRSLSRPSRLRPRSRPFLRRHPSPAEPPVSAQNSAIAAAYDDARLRILRSLERGEIDVAEAGQRLEALDGIDPLDEPDRRRRTHRGRDHRREADDVDGTETARFDPNAPTDA